MSEGSVKQNRLLGLLAALTIALTGLAWTGCGDDENNNDSQQVERSAEDAQGEGEEALDDVQQEVEGAGEEAQEKAEEAGDEAQKRLDDAKEEGEEKLDEAKEEIERYAP